MDIKKELIGSYIIICLNDNTKYYGQVKNFDDKCISLVNIVVNGKPFSYPESVKSISTKLIKSYEVLDLTESKIVKLCEVQSEENFKSSLSSSNSSENKSARINLNTKRFVATYDEKWQQMFPKQYEKKIKEMEIARTKPKNHYFGLRSFNRELKPNWSTSILLNNGLIYQTSAKCKPTGATNIFDCIQKHFQSDTSEEHPPFFNPFKYKTLQLDENESNDEMQDSDNVSEKDEQKEFNKMLSRLKSMGCNSKSVLDEATIKEAYENILAEKKQAMLKEQKAKENAARRSISLSDMRTDVFGTKTGFIIPAIRLTERTEIVTLMNRSMKKDNVNNLIAHCIYRSLMEIWDCNVKSHNKYPAVVIFSAINCDAIEIGENLNKLAFKKMKMWLVSEEKIKNRNSYRECVKDFCDYGIDFVVICLQPMCNIKWIQNLEYWFKDLNITMFLIDPPINYKPLAPLCKIYGFVPVLPLIGFNPNTYDELLLCNLCISDKLINSVVGGYENPFEEHIFVPIIDASKTEKKNG